MKSAVSDGFYGVLRDGIVAFLGALLVGAGMVATAVLLFHHGGELSGWGWGAGVGWVALVAIITFWGVKLRPGRERRWWLVLLAIAVVVKGLLLASTAGYPQTADRQFFHDTVAQMVDGGGLTADNLGELSASYDYYLWMQRSFPFGYPIRVIFGERDVAVFRVLSLGLALANLGLLYCVARSIFAAPQARAAVALFGLMPLRNWNVLDYSHQVHAEFFLLGALAVLLRRLADPEPVRMRAVAEGLVLGGLLFLLHLQRGVDLLLIIFMGVFVILTAWRKPAPGWLPRLAVIIVLPLVVGLPLSHAFDGWRDGMDRHHHSSGILGFMARGWSLESMGEFDGKYEQMDRVAPVDQKKTLMAAVPLSQLRYHPKEVTTHLLPRKMLTFFLVGYASGIEGGLKEGGLPTHLAAFRGMRLLYAPPFLLLAGWGAWLILARRRESPLELALASLPLVGCGIFVLLGETSPRYSYYVQAALALLAAIPLTPHAVRWGSRQAIGRLAVWGVVLAILYGAALGAASVGARTVLADRTFRDVGEVTRDAANPGVAADVPAPSLIPYLRHLSVEGAGPVTDRLPVAGPGTVSLYLWPQGPAETWAGREVTVAMDDREVARLSVAEVSPIRYVACEVGEAAELAVTVTASGEALGAGGVRWGYVFVSPSPGAGAPPD